MIHSELQVLKRVQAAASPVTRKWEEILLPQERWFRLTVRVGNKCHCTSGAGHSCLRLLEKNPNKPTQQLEDLKKLIVGVDVV